MGFVAMARLLLEVRPAMELSAGGNVRGLIHSLLDNSSAENRRVEIIIQPTHRSAR
jgi:hypothetical protein